jgi:DNA mismatch repair protein MSH6
VNETALQILINNEGTEDGSLLKLLNRCVTSFGMQFRVSGSFYQSKGNVNNSNLVAGKRLFRIWLCMPLRNVVDINARLDAVEDILNHSTFEADFADIAKGLPDLERIVSRIHANNCKVKDFLKVLAVSLPVFSTPQSEISKAWCYVILLLL